MAENSAIEWCDHTFNPWEGCQKVSPGCDHCYAEARNARFGGGYAPNWGPGAPRRRTSASNWRKPLQWQAGAAEFLTLHNRRQRVFCASLADWLDNDVPIEWLVDLLQLVHDTPNLDWLLLSKRIGNWSTRISEAIGYVDDKCQGYSPQLRSWLAHWLDSDEAPRSVWLGSTVVNQSEADRDIPKLLAIPAAVRFLSVEPMLGPVDLERPRPGPDLDQGGGQMICQPWLIQSGIDWVICGGESGPKARPMHPDWARSLRDQCAAAGVQFLFKQWGEFMPPESNQAKYPGKDWRDVVDATGSTRPVHFVGDAVLESSRQVVRVGKKAAGRLLDGKQHDSFPRAGRS